MGKLTSDERDDLDMAVLAAVRDCNMQATYVLRNHLDWPGKPWHRKGVTTPTVLRACRRLEKAGMVERNYRTPYVIMHSWQITDAGRATLTGAPK